MFVDHASLILGEGWFVSEEVANDTAGLVAGQRSYGRRSEFYLRFCEGDPKSRRTPLELMEGAT
jgi:hypothetical protein